MIYIYIYIYREREREREIDSKNLTAVNGRMFSLIDR